MLTTQISALLQRIVGNNEESIEETARLLAQATFGEGKVFFATFEEMKAVEFTALNGVEAFQGAAIYEEELDLGKEDRVWIITRSCSNKDAVQLAEKLASQFIPFAVIAAEKEDSKLADLATTYISTSLTKGLLPGEDGERFVEPHALAALFIYEAVKMAYDEMLADE